jgi:hypothetical protein
MDDDLDSGDGTFVVTWKNYAGEVFGSLRKHLRLNAFTRDRFSDVILYCGGKKFFAHKIILAACSNFFEKILFDLPPIQASEIVLVITDVDPDTMDHLLDFMYKGEICLESQLVENFLQAAHKIGIRGLKNGLSEEGQQSSVADKGESFSFTNSRKRVGTSFDRGIQDEVSEPGDSNGLPPGGCAKRTKRSAVPLKVRKKYKIITEGCMAITESDVQEKKIRYKREFSIKMYSLGFLDEEKSRKIFFSFFFSGSSSIFLRSNVYDATM